MTQFGCRQCFHSFGGACTFIFRVDPEDADSTYPWNVGNMPTSTPINLTSTILIKSQLCKRIVNISCWICGTHSRGSGISHRLVRCNSTVVSLEHRFHIQDRRVRQGRNQYEASRASIFSSFAACFSLVSSLAYSSVLEMGTICQEMDSSYIYYGF